MNATDIDFETQQVAERWCAARGQGWSLKRRAGRGGTAPVYEVESPTGDHALKILDLEYSSGDMFIESKERIRLQLQEIGQHSCSHLIQVLDGGEFEGRLYILMNLAPGEELSKNLHLVPREKIRGIVDQIARACAFLREKGLCHRDIKVENIFISEDFNHATLLDVSVIRSIHDPIGLGTDHGNKLPVVATSRYTPPEYLFRLLEPGEDLWHAVDIYQLGCLIHDLVMRCQMYDEEFNRASDNRYRFAWIVATQTPVIQANDVDTALVLLGQRALDRDWQRRSSLKLEDFFAERQNLAKIGRAAIGIGAKTAGEKVSGPSNIRQIISGYADHVKEEVRKYLISQSVRANHTSRSHGGDGSWEVLFEWSLGPKSQTFERIQLTYLIAFVATAAKPAVQLTSTLRASGAIGNKEATVAMPPIDLDDEASSRLYTFAIGSLDELTGKLVED